MGSDGMGWDGMDHRSWIKMVGSAGIRNFGEYWRAIARAHWNLPRIGENNGHRQKWEMMDSFNSVT